MGLIDEELTGADPCNFPRVEAIPRGPRQLVKVGSKIHWVLEKEKSNSRCRPSRVVATGSRHGQASLVPRITKAVTKAPRKKRTHL